MATVTEKPDRAEGEPRRLPVPVGGRGLELRTMDDLWRFALAVSKSGLAPKGLASPEAVLVALQFGMELGLTPMAALQNVYPVNGRPALFGDAPLAVCRASGLLEEFEEWYEVKPGEKLDHLPEKPPDCAAAVCRVRRRGDKESRVSRFTVGDAKQAKLWGKEGPWTFYPFRLLRFRARSYALRDALPDVLKGLLTAEELRDHPPEAGRTERLRGRLGPPPEADPAPDDDDEPLKVREDLFDQAEDFAQRIAAADTPAELDRVQAGLAEWEHRLGEEGYRRALQAVRERRLQLARA